MICAFPFAVDTDYMGIMGLGAKLIGEPYNKDDEELLDTLVNNLVVALWITGDREGARAAIGQATCS